MDVALDELRVNYPDDRIQITQKGRKPGMPAPPEPEWKLKCVRLSFSIFPVIHVQQLT